MTSGRSTYKGVLKRVANAVPKKFDKIMQDVVLTTTNKLIDKTPVLTGAAKYHWFLRAQPDEKFDKKRVDPGGATVKSRAKRDIKLFKVGMNFYIVNSAPYMELLNDGWSDKAPAGFIEMAVNEVNPLYRHIFKVEFTKKYT